MMLETVVAGWLLFAHSNGFDGRAISQVGPFKTEAACIAAVPRIQKVAGVKFNRWDCIEVGVERGK